MLASMAYMKHLLLETVLHTIPLFGRTHRPCGSLSDGVRVCVLVLPTETLLNAEGTPLRQALFSLKRMLKVCML